MQPMNPMNMMNDLPKEAKQKIEKTKKELNKFKDNLLKNDKKEIMGISLIPPPESLGLKSDPNRPKDEVNVLVLINDKDLKPMEMFNLKNKHIKSTNDIAVKINKNLRPQVMLLSELWQNCYDQKWDVVKLIGLSTPVYDTGMLAAFKISEIHKTMVLKKFERYIVSYVLAGSLTQGKATAESDIDVFIVIDDTDVKRMTRYELKEKLRAIIIGMGIEAGEMTGIRNKLNIQVYILTDFWDSIKEANPVIFTFLRDGVPMHDTGTFLPWKQLLKMGKIKPSAEAIDLYMHTGEEIISKVKRKMKEMGMEDTYWAILTPSQAALMLYGVPPPTPRDTPILMKELFVDKEKILEQKYIDILSANIQLRKDLEHQKKKEVSGVEIDKYINDADDYLKRLRKLFDQIKDRKEGESIAKNYDEVVSNVRDLLKLQGVAKVSEKDVLQLFNDKFIETSLIESKYSRKIKNVIDSFDKFKKGKINKAEISKMKKDSFSVLKRLVEYRQEQFTKDLDRCRIQVKYADKYGEIINLKNKVFVVKEKTAKEKEVFVAKLEKGRIGALKPSSFDDLDKELKTQKQPENLTVNGSLMKDIETIFGKKVEVFLK